MVKMHPYAVQFLGLCYLEGSMLMERTDSSLDELLEGVNTGLPLGLK